MSSTCVFLQHGFGVRVSHLMYRLSDHSDARDVDRGARFMRLFLSSQPRIYALILSMLPRWSEADDVMQETSAVLWSKFDEYRDGTNFTAWALSIARFQVLYHRKKMRSANKRLSDQTVEMLADEMAAFAMADMDDRRAALERCVSKLRESDRKLIEDRYHGGATANEMAERTGRTPAAVYKAIGRVHRLLLECVRRTLGATMDTEDRA